MASFSGRAELIILRRLIAYAEKIFHFSSVISAGVSDRRRQPRIPGSDVVKMVVLLFWTRMGSLNALELAGPSRFFRHGWGCSTCSVDSVGRIATLMDAATLRSGIHHVYERLKLNKALPDEAGLAVAALDGHESHASYLRHCPGCLERTINACKPSERIQYYHRQVTLMLLPAARPGREPVRLLLDAEPQKPGEDEVARTTANAATTTASPATRATTECVRETEKRRRARPTRSLWFTTVPTPRRRLRSRASARRAQSLRLRGPGEGQW